jgi:hypothetical protein
MSACFYVSQYAKQARNIQNKPVQNMDKTQMELRRLKYALKVNHHHHQHTYIYPIVSSTCCCIDVSNSTTQRCLSWLSSSTLDIGLDHEGDHNEVSGMSKLATY